MTMARPLWKRAGYNVMKAAFCLTAVVLFRYRCRGRGHIPRLGGVLICANHQSFFDPVLVGICFPCRLNYLARQTLFHIFAFGWLIRYLDAIPIDREGLGISGLKETLRRLKRGEMMLVFPEGTRSADGNLGPLRPGFVALARRGRVPVLPMAVDGAFDAWPRTSRWPRLTTLRSCIGTAISTEQMEQLSDEELIAELAERLEQCHRQARQDRLRDD